MRKSLFLLSFITIAGWCSAQMSNSDFLAQKSQKKSSGKTGVFAGKSRHKNSGDKFNGQWRGYFDANGNIGSFNKDNTEYVLELNIDGTEISGYSYSYFQERTYYTICSLSGKYDPAERSITVTEIRRIKGFTSPGWTDCFQTHYLTYKKENGVEKLVGKWSKAPGETGNCGTGSTVLTRKTLKNSIASYKKSGKINSPFSSPMPNDDDIAMQKKPKAKDSNLDIKNNPTDKAQISSEPALKSDVKPAETEVKKEILPKPVSKETAKSPEEKNYAKRSNEVLKTIEIENEKFVVTLYDNGEIDGDSVSLFYNGKLLISHQMLSDRPMTLTLNASTGREVNELTMYAENLGTIPPNTALMIVMDGDTRYEVRITSDLQKSGTIRFVHKSKAKKDN